MINLKSLKKKRPPYIPSSDDPLVELRRLQREHRAITKRATGIANSAADRKNRTTGEVIPNDLPDDVKLLAPAVLPHRLILSSQTRLRGRDTSGVLEEVLEEVPAPVER